jgi:hypothetical protein
MKNIPPKSDVNIMFKRQAHIEWESPSLVGRGIANPHEASSVVFSRNNLENYLKARKKSNFKQILCYAQKYADVLSTGDASTPVSLQSAAVRRHAIEALSAFAWRIGHVAKTKLMRISILHLNFEDSGQNAIVSVVKYKEP